MPRNIVKGKFFSSNVTVTAASTYSTTTPLLRCENLKQVQVSAVALGANASATGLVTIALQSCVGDEHWSTAAWQSLTVTLAGTASITAPAEILNVEGLSAIRVMSITNADATYACTANLIYGASVQ